MRAALLAALVASPALAQSSALVVACGDCNPFQAIQVLLDGRDMATNPSVRLVDVAPGTHEVKVVKWVSPFKTEVSWEGVVDFPVNVELRARVTKGKLDVYGRGPYAPPPPPQRGPSEAQLLDAREELREAKELVQELQEDVEDGADACVGKLAGRLGSLEDAVKDALGSTSPEWVAVARDKADAATKAASGCRKRRGEKWERTLGRVRARLDAAARALRSR